MTPSDEGFSVYWWDCDGCQHQELSNVGAEAAVKAAHRLIKGPAALLRIVHRVMITDSLDFCNFEWKIGEGITFPPDITFLSTERGPKRNPPS